VRKFAASLLISALAWTTAPVTGARASEFSQPWKNPDRALVIDAYEYNPIDWAELTKDKRIVGFINKGSDGLPPPYFCSGDEAAVTLCKAKWRRHAVAQELFQTRKALAGALGLKWGAYHLGRPGNPVEQADNFLTFTRPGPDDLMAIDIEDNDPQKWMSLSDAEIFASEINRRTGRWPVLYTNGSTAKHIADEKLKYPILSRLPLWYARYKPEIGIHFPKGNWDSYTLWQFSAQANCGPRSCPYRVAGAKFDIDVNVVPMDAKTLRAAWPFGSLLPERSALVAQEKRIEETGPTQVPLPIWREAAAAGNVELVLAAVESAGPSLMGAFSQLRTGALNVWSRTFDSMRMAISRSIPSKLPEPAVYAALATPAGYAPAMDGESDPQAFREIDRTVTSSISRASTFNRDDLPVLLLEPLYGVGENFEDLFRGARQNDLAAADNDGTLDQNRVSQHEINQLIIAPAWVIEPQLIIGRVFTSQQFTR
jgi:GH25 family lysozyme M1 (1,4-beta-N-acetylmuramidase)